MIKKEHLELKEEEKGSGGGCHQQRQLGFLSLGDSPLRLFFAAPPQLSWATRPDWEAPWRTDSSRQNLSPRPSDFIDVPCLLFPPASSTRALPSGHRQNCHFVSQLTQSPRRLRCRPHWPRDPRNAIASTLTLQQMAYCLKYIVLNINYE